MLHVHVLLRRVQDGNIRKVLFLSKVCTCRQKGGKEEEEEEEERERERERPLNSKLTSASYGSKYMY